MDPLLFAGILAAIFLAAVIHGMTGFGFAMVLVIILPHIGVNYFNMLSIISIFSVLITAVYATIYRKHIRWNWLPLVLISCVLADLLAVYILSRYRQLAWDTYLGLFLILLTCYFIFWQKKIKIEATPANGLLTGASGGLLEGFFGIGGPPAVLYFLAVAKEDKYAYLATIQLYFVVLCSFDFAFRLHFQLITLDLSTLLLPGILCILLGTFCGYRLMKIISVELMKYCIYGLLFLNGILLLLH